MNRVQEDIRLFSHIQQDNATRGVGKGRAGLPNAFGQTTQSFLSFDAATPSVLLNIEKANHNKSLTHRIYMDI